MIRLKTCKSHSPRATKMLSSRPGGGLSAGLVGFYGPGERPSSKVERASGLAAARPGDVPFEVLEGRVGGGAPPRGDAAEGQVAATAPEALRGYMVGQLMRDRQAVERREQETQERHVLLHEGGEEGGSLEDGEEASEVPEPLGQDSYATYAEYAAAAGQHLSPPAATSGVNVNLDVDHQGGKGGVNINMHVAGAVRGHGDDSDGYSKRDVAGGKAILSFIQGDNMPHQGEQHREGRGAVVDGQQHAAAASRPTHTNKKAMAKHSTHRAAVARTKQDAARTVKESFGGVQLEESWKGPKHGGAGMGVETDKFNYKGFGMDLAATLKVEKWEPGAAAWYAYADNQGKYDEVQQMSQSAASKTGATATRMLAVAGAVAACIMGYVATW
jgi:hypothetical protein